MIYLLLEQGFIERNIITVGSVKEITTGIDIKEKRGDSLKLNENSMKKHIVLVTYSFKPLLGFDVTTKNRIVSVMAESRISETEAQQQACEGLAIDFNRSFPDHDLISIQATAPLTVYPDDVIIQKEIPVGWFTSDVKPFVDPETKDWLDGMLSDYVLIDLDGKRNDYAIGCYHYPYTLDGVYTDGWWSVDEFKQSALEVHNMRWSYLPLKRYEK